MGGGDWRGFEGLAEGLGCGYAASYEADGGAFDIAFAACDLPGKADGLVDFTPTLTLPRQGGGEVFLF